MEPASFHSLSLEDVALIVKNRFRAGYFALIEPQLETLWRASSSLPELINKIEEELRKRATPSKGIDPAHQAIIDNRFRTLVINELAKRFGDDLKLVSNLEDIVNSGSTLRGIQYTVQAAINTIKLKKL